MIRCNQMQSRTNEGELNINQRHGASIHSSARVISISHSSSVSQADERRNAFHAFFPSWCIRPTKFDRAGKFLRNRVCIHTRPNIPTFLEGVLACVNVVLNYAVARM
eukprot:TRINITY_DN17440_c0_g1_i1.p1 TRINITY_DN17440_c0_g1~~TRINITY_DN17440_c0_g1_i1.p1  ORF type:complete len:107 (-),score=2.49 TRINITY_DN17440_c0_g1_i1:79-399(-)